MASDLGDFLRARRAALSPGDLGLAAGPARRRVRGLRREELALAAGISVDYYVRLEQGRTRNVSDAVIDSVADALRLGPDERSYLRHLVRPPRQSPGRTAPQRVRPGLRRLMDQLHDAPAVVLGRRLDVLAWNRAALAVLDDFATRSAPERNFARLVFAPDRAAGNRPRFDDATAEEVVGALRLSAARHPDDPGLTALVDELLRDSGRFRRLWSSGTVRRRPHGPRTVHHPVRGTLTMYLETLTLPDDPDQTLLTYTNENPAQDA
ncbi:helix-turn-helix domain-containing protein [Streptomyces sp. NPDC007189]|uniref:helix-turn-helix domain-containing protein n=1 Tax=Streptomyces sp. NPDC007189 TaxID=3154315 RepID=UPI003454EC6C